MARHKQFGSVEFLRAALADGAGESAPVSTRLHLRDQNGDLLPRPTEPPAGEVPVPAAVLVLLYPHQDDLHLLFTERTNHLRSHAGQVSFPGGRVEAGDGSLLDAALRETREELGMDTSSLEVVSALQPVYIPRTNYLVHPFVMYSAQPPALAPNPSEVARVFAVPLSTLLRPDCLTVETRNLAGQEVSVPGFRCHSSFIWGATAHILEQLLNRIAARL